MYGTEGKGQNKRGRKVNVERDRVSTCVLQRRKYLKTEREKDRKRERRKERKTESHEGKRKTGMGKHGIMNEKVRDRERKKKGEK
jgi:hypothetical protein